MSIARYGRAHRWFAWHPVETDQEGWKWLRVLWRRRCDLDVIGAPTFWVYDTQPPA